MVENNQESSAHSNYCSEPSSLTRKTENKNFERFNDQITSGSPSLLAPGTATNAGGPVENLSYFDAFKTLKFKDFQNLHKKPCARDSLMIGIGAGFTLGGLRAIRGGLWF